MMSRANAVMNEYTETEGHMALETDGRIGERHRVGEGEGVRVDEGAPDGAGTVACGLAEPPDAVDEVASLPAGRAEGVAGVVWVAAGRELGAEH